MKIVYLAISLFLITSSTSRAQQSSLTIGLGKPLESHSSVDITGSPYLTADFHSSQVTTPGNHTLTGVQLRYNVYSQTIECMVNNQIFDVTDSVSSFNYTDSVMQVNTFFKGAAPINAKSIYFKILVKGNFSLLKSYEAEITSDEDWYTKKVTKKYVTKSDYFLFAGNKVTKLGTSKKSFITAFNNDPVVKDQLNKETPDFKDESSLINFFTALK